MRHTTSRPLPQPAALPLAIASLCLGALPAQAATYAPWLTQIGLSDTVVSAAKWGQGQLLGVVDTGITATHPVFASGQVSKTLSACAAKTFGCTSGYADDNGHGTAVAAIAAANKTYAYASNYGGYSVQAGSVVSVAPNANIVAEKVLNAAGTGTSADVANGIRKAADAGVSVINVSITYGNTSDIVAAINYAAGKGAFIVWAGGNSSTLIANGRNTTGLTPQALNRLLFVGSVTRSNTLSSFSNRPGGAGLVTTTQVLAAYASRWVVAPGEAILAPNVAAGPNAWAYWSGTSMSAPLVSGSLILLENAWPILRTNGSAANLLLATTTDLGAAGTDTTYGTGLVNLTKAFQPVGGLNVTRANGQPVAVTALTRSLITAGALGSLSSVQSKLSSYTALDAYKRNYTVNLSSLISTPAGKTTLNPLPAYANTGVRAIKLADGGELSFWQDEPASRFGHQGEFGYNAEFAPDRRGGYAMLTDTHGHTTALGFKAPVQYAFSRALLGDETLASLAAETTVQGLGQFAEGGSMAAWGTQLDESLRVAMSWNSTASVPMGAHGNWSPTWATPDARNASVGASYRLTPRLTAGAAVGVLDENHGLLGATYDTHSALSLGERNRSLSYSLSMGYRLSANRSLLLEAGLATTRANHAEGMFAGTTGLQSRTWGASYLTRNLWRRNDQLTASIRQPLRVSQGSAEMVTTDIDEAGVAHYGTERVSLVPDGREIDYKLSYALPVDRHSNFAIQTRYHRDAFNIRGAHDAAIGATWTRRF